jgi:lysine 2,3-aminomutase
MKQFEGKRLLHLGGDLFQTPALICARRLGCEVILVDQNPQARGRVYADLFLPVSTRDVDGVLAVAREYRVDGVMTYASDSSVATVATVAATLGLPGNPATAAETIRNKDLFRKFQKEHGLPHPGFFVSTPDVDVLGQVGQLKFPIVVKPVDAAGTVGQSVIHTVSEVERALAVALDYSAQERAIFEEYVHADMMELDGDVLVENGRLAFRHYGHNYFLRDRISNVPSGELFPGFFPPSMATDIDSQFDTIIQKLGLRMGCMNFDALARDGQVYILDVGLRNGGNYVPDAIKLSTGFDLTEAAVYAALGVPYAAEHRPDAPARPVATYLMGSRFPGVFQGVRISTELQPYTVEVRHFLEVGDPIGVYERAECAAGIAFFQFPDMDTLQEKVANMEDLVSVQVLPVSAARAGDRARLRRGELVSGEFRQFPELVSPFLRGKLEQAHAEDDQDVLRVLSRQYIESPEETTIREAEGLKHYEAAQHTYWEGERLSAVERLYRRVILFEPLYQCIANCRYCLRRNYDLFNQSKEDIQRIARYIGNAPGHEDLREVLVTGGDPFIAPHKVGVFLEAVAEHAPQVRTARVATRVPIHQPDRVNGEILEVLARPYPFRVEVATQINHACELFPEVRAAYNRIREVAPIYNQSVLLRGVNDTIHELVDLCDAVRELAIENHYLFHCVPIGGLNALRTPLARSIELARQLSASGKISGRAKPHFCLMTSIGKITPYEGTIVDYRDNRYLLRSGYSYAERMEWNPAWQLPDNAVVGEDGVLSVWYEDAAAGGTAEPAALRRLELPIATPAAG